MMNIAYYALFCWCVIFNKNIFKNNINKNYLYFIYDIEDMGNYFFNKNYG